MAIVKIILIAVITALVTLYLKKYTPETAVLASIAGGLMIIFLIADYALGIADYIRDFFGKTELDGQAVGIVFKITAIAYIIEFAAGAVKDLGEEGLSAKIILAGKIAILSMSFPVISSLFSLVVKIING